MDDNLEVVQLIREVRRFKEESELGEDFSADAIDWEIVFQSSVEHYVPTGWKTICCHNPDPGHWEEFLVPPEEAAQVHKDEAR